MSLAPLMTSNSEHWCTPPVVLETVSKFNDGKSIYLDPCSNANSIVGALEEWRLERDGDSLEKPWPSLGLAFINPPFGDALKRWAEKLAYEAARGVEIVALLPARTDTVWFTHVWSAQAICFWRRRLKFLGAPSSAPFPSCIAYWGPRVYRFADVFEKRGHVVLGVGR